MIPNSRYFRGFGRNVVSGSPCQTEIGNEFSKNFSKIKYVGHSKVSVRGQEIVRFEIEASSKRSGKRKFS